MSDADLTAQFEEAAEREAQRGYDMHKLVRDSDAAHALRALFGHELADAVRARIEAEQQSNQPSRAA